MAFRRAWLMRLLLALNVTMAYGDEITLKIVGENAPPVRMFGRDSCTGLYCDLLNEAAKRLHWHLVYQEVPSKRAFMMMRYGDADLMLGPNKAVERDSYLSYLDTPLPASTKAFFQAPGSPPIHSDSDLKGRLVCIELGKLYANDIAQVPGVRIEQSTDALTSLRKAEAKRCDAALMPEMEGDAIRHSYTLSLVKADYFIVGRPSYVAISKKSPHLGLQQQLDDMLRELSRDGTMQAIIRRYP